MCIMLLTDVTPVNLLKKKREKMWGGRGPQQSSGMKSLSEMSSVVSAAHGWLAWGEGPGAGALRLGHRHHLIIWSQFRMQPFLLSGPTHQEQRGLGFLWVRNPSANPRARASACRAAPAPSGPAVSFAAAPPCTQLSPPGRASGCGLTSA